MSPLLALMRDQLQRLPPGLPGAMLQGAMTRQQLDDVMGRAARGELRLLFLGPEKLASGAVLSALRALPTLPLVVVDEAHCVAVRFFCGVEGLRGWRVPRPLFVH